MYYGASAKLAKRRRRRSIKGYAAFLLRVLKAGFVHGSVIQLIVMDLCTKKLGMQIELHRKNVYQGVELLLLVSMLFLLAIPKSLPIFKENFYYTSIYSYDFL